MKKYLSYILLLSCLAIGITSAQAKMRWGATAGVTVNSLKFKQDLVPVSSTIGYEAGATGEIIFPGIGIGLDIGLMYNQQGGMVDLGSRKIWSSLGYSNEHIYIHNILLPVHLRWKYTNLNGIEDIVAPIIYGGPEFNIQAAHGSCDAIKFSGGDLGLTVGLGAELYKNWQITAGYTWGMTYVLKTRLLEDFSARSRQWTVRVAYYF